MQTGERAFLTFIFDEQDVDSVGAGPAIKCNKHDVLHKLMHILQNQWRPSLLTINIFSYQVNISCIL